MTPFHQGPPDGATNDRPGPPPRPAEPAGHMAARPQRPRGRYGHEVATSRDAEVARLHGRAERAEAELAEQRREAARAIGALQAEVAFWRLRVQGESLADAAAGAGLLEAPAE